jgi:serine/threonine protein kinase
MLLRQKADAGGSIGPYELRDTIGRGSFATVRIAFHTEQNELYACKIVPFPRIQSAQTANSFEREIGILRQLRHPSIVRLYDFLKDAENYYVILEYCPGGDFLSKLGKDHPLPEDQARAFFRQILIAVDHCHSLGIAHRDLKPENLLLDTSGHLKLSDFGFSRFCRDHELSSTQCGSPLYTAPEIMGGHSYLPRLTDLWSLGVILYHIVAGRLPWKSTNKLHLWRQIAAGDIIFPETLSPACVSLLQQLMKIHPKERITCREALAHEWFEGVEVSLPNSVRVPFVSLKKIDHLLKGEEPFVCPEIHKSPSTGALADSFAKEAKKIRDGPHERQCLPPMLGRRGTLPGSPSHATRVLGRICGPLIQNRMSPRLVPNLLTFVD